MLQCMRPMECKQPWTFTVVRDRKMLDEISRDAKSYMLANMTPSAQAEQIGPRLSEPDFHIFITRQLLLEYSPFSPLDSDAQIHLSRSRGGSDSRQNPVDEVVVWPRGGVACGEAQLSCHCSAIWKSTPLWTVEAQP